MRTSQSLHLTKRNNGIWYLGYEKYQKRHWKTTKCRNKSDALSFLKAYNPAEDTPRSGVTLSELFDELSNAKTLRPNTICSYSIAVNRLTALCGDKKLDEYKSEDLARFKQDLLNSKVSQTSVNIWIRSLVAVFSHAVKRGNIARNPFSLSQTIKIAKQPPVFMSQEEFAKLLTVVKSQTLKDFFTVAGNTGLRLSEIINLMWDNVSLDKKQIAVVNSEEFTTKSGKSRIVPMNDKVFELFANRIAANANNGFVFCKSNGYKFDGAYVSHSFKKYVRCAKLNEKYHCHTMRHSFASWLAMKEVPIFSIQQLLGHASVNTTLQYAHLSSSVLHSAVNKL